MRELPLSYLGEMTDQEIDDVTGLGDLAAFLSTVDGLGSLGATKSFFDVLKKALTPSAALKKKLKEGVAWLKKNGVAAVTMTANVVSMIYPPAAPLASAIAGAVKKGLNSDIAKKLLLAAGKTQVNASKKNQEALLKDLDAKKKAVTDAKAKGQPVPEKMTVTPDTLKDQGGETPPGAEKIVAVAATVQKKPAAPAPAKNAILEMTVFPKL